MKTSILVLLLLLLVGSIFAATTSAETNIFSITPQTLPVVLSSFSAVQTSSGFVFLRWTTESETELLGYRVYRGSSDNLIYAINLSSQIIPATNTSTTQIYSYEDREIEMQRTYYYWLESLEYQHSDFHGPISVNISGTESPELPLQTALQAVYPNPFHQGASAKIEVMVKENEAATVTIYNLNGQRVRSYSLASGSHLLSWDAKDSRGNPVGSGIYFVKLSSASMNQSAKLMLIK